VKRALAASALAGTLLFAGAAAPPPHLPGSGPRRARVLLVSVDGLRPDVLLRAKVPHLRGLMARGSFTMWAETVPMAVTLPSHTSMLTGVPVEKHGVTWNDAQPAATRVYPRWPTLFELAHQAGYTTAMAAGKAKFSTLDRPGSVNWSFVSPGDVVVPDSIVAAIAAHWIAVHAPQVLFVHFPGADFAGHEFGWGSPAQIAAVENIDRCIGRMLDALDRKGLLASTTILVTADHGGAGRTHGSGDARSGHIPWILAGPGVRRNYDLTQEASLTVHTEDTFATLCEVLGITPPQPVDGRPVDSAFEIAPAAQR
jgi:predicted AlkP superfamily pyrophosphatase or phosphodiesterase